MKRMVAIATIFLLLPAILGASDLLPNSGQTGTFVVPGQEGMHKELIPKSITIVHVSYELDVVAPGTTFAFDLIGSGFDEAFYKIITVDPDALDVTVKNLRLVTPNQIHGQIEVGPEATTQYIHPLVTIRSLPVFRAPDPFGVVRPGEVLDIELTSIDENGQWGHFRVTTNLDEHSYQNFRLAPTSSLLEISNLKPQYPFYVDGVLMIGQGLRHGQYGVVASMGKREIFRIDPIVDVVKPTVGKTGSIEKVLTSEKAHRPGDTLDLQITGSAFQADSVASLSLRVTPTDMGPGTIAFESAGLLRGTLQIPAGAAVGVYGVNVMSGGKVLQEEHNVFAVVPPNWIAAVKLTAPLSPGKSGELIILGRDMTPEFTMTLQLGTDTEGLQVTNLRWQNPSTLAADIAVAANLAPGDYLINVTAGGKALKLPRGNIIKITP